MDEAYSTPSCKGGAGGTRRAVRSIKQATIARMTELEVSGAPFGFRIRNEHFVSGIDGSPGAQEAAEAPRASHTASCAAREWRRTMGEP